MPSTATDRLHGLTTSVAVKPPCVVAATSNITLSGTQTIGAVAVVSGDRVLVTAQTSSVDNGIWVVSAGAWSRATDFDGSRDVVGGTLVLVGTTAATSQFWLAYGNETPIVPGTTAITFEQVDYQELTLRSDLASTASASVGAGIAGWRPSLTYASGTVGKALSDREWSITDYPFNAVGDDSTDNYAAILAAQSALAAAGGGTLVIPEGTFRILTAIPRVANVDYRGLGWASILKPVGCGAFTYAFTTGFGQSATRNMWIQGSSGAAQIGIYQAGTLDDADELYGVLIEDCAITGFNVGIQFRTVRNCTIRNNWIQDVNSGINLIGKCLVFHISGNKIVKGAGSGTGTSRCVYLELFNYTGGTGQVGPEGIQLHNNFLYGFDYGVVAVNANVVNMSFNDFAALFYGVEFTSVSNGLNIIGNFFDMSGANVLAAIIGHGVGSGLSTQVCIEQNSFLASSSTSGTSVGIVVNDAANTNQNHVNIVRNYFNGFEVYDIQLNNPGPCNVENNRCFSSAPTNSIRVLNTITGPVYVDKNHCLKAISVDAGIPAGACILGTNTDGESVVSTGGVETLTGAGAIGLTTRKTLIVTTAADAITLADGYEGQEKYITMKTDGGAGTLTPTNLYNGTTITFDDVGDSAHLMFMDGQWVFMGGTATLA